MGWNSMITVTATLTETGHHEATTTTTIVTIKSDAYHLGTTNDGKDPPGSVMGSDWPLSLSQHWKLGDHSKTQHASTFFQLLPSTAHPVLPAVGTARSRSVIPASMLRFNLGQEPSSAKNATDVTTKTDSPSLGDKIRKRFWQEPSSAKNATDSTTKTDCPSLLDKIRKIYCEKIIIPLKLFRFWPNNKICKQVKETRATEAPETTTQTDPTTTKTLVPVTVPPVVFETTTTTTTTTPRTTTVKKGTPTTSKTKPVTVPTVSVTTTKEIKTTKTSTTSKPTTTTVDYNKGRPNCGLLNARVKRIAGGEESPSAIPWQVAIVSKENNLVCGGALIDSYHVLTAAHCFVPEEGGVDKNTASVVIGYNNGKAAGLPRIQQIFIEGCIDVHPGYGRMSPNLLVDNIAVITLKTKADDATTPICLPGPEKRGAGNCYVSGYGEKSLGEPTEFVRKAKINRLTTQACINEYPESRTYFEKDWTFCGGGNNTGTCRYDDGGPLYCETRDGQGKRYELTGVVSRKPKTDGTCGSKPDIFTAVSKYLDWIHEKQTTPNKCSPSD